MNTNNHHVKERLLIEHDKGNVFVPYYKIKEEQKRYQKQQLTNLFKRTQT